jgi:hypothetical protein
MRSLRLAYAHEIDVSRRTTWIFKFMKHEYFLVLFFALVTVLKTIPILVSNYNSEDVFLTFIDINTYTYDTAAKNQELSFGIK